jgi:hypothetical protein
VGARDPSVDTSGDLQRGDLFRAGAGRVVRMKRRERPWRRLLAGRRPSQSSPWRRRWMEWLCKARRASGPSRSQQCDPAARQSAVVATATRYCGAQSAIVVTTTRDCSTPVRRCGHNNPVLQRASPPLWSQQPGTAARQSAVVVTATRDCSAPVRCCGHNNTVLRHAAHRCGHSNAALPRAGPPWPSRQSGPRRRGRRAGSTMHRRSRRRRPPGSP